jgi:enoyl-CoA hydratase/carnithine racemase
MAIKQPSVDKERESMEVVKVSRPAPGVMMIELSDPPANTYTHQMFRQLDNAILEARFDDEISVIFITGEGEKFFCAGANIKMLEESDPHWKYFFCLHANETLSRLEQSPKLVVAGLNGHTVGGGLEIAMAADIRIARRDAGRCGLPEVNLGVLPGTGGTQRLLRMVGKSKAIELMCSGRLFAFEEALDWGIINDIYDGDGESFREQMIDYCKQFTLPNKATKVVGNIKRSVQSGAEMSFESGLTLERELQKALFDSQDAKEGLNAFNSKRTPSFKGI